MANNNNPLVIAHQKLVSHIDNLLGNADSLEKRQAELMKLKKEDLVALLLESTKVNNVKVEDIAKVILEDPDCAWLDYSTIATAIRSKLEGCKTSEKSLASYASKNPKAKGWVVVPRKSASERTAELNKLVNLG